MEKNYIIPPQTRYEPGSYYYFPEVITPEEVKQLEKDIEDLDTINGFAGDEVNTSIRSSLIKWLPQEEKFLWLYERLIGKILHANLELWNFSISGTVDCIQYTVYPANENGKYDWHMDIGPNSLASYRKLSVTIQLSHPDEYEGGNLELNLGSEIVQIEKQFGMATIFPSFLVHRITPITKGVRKSLVLWIGGDQFR